MSSVCNLHNGMGGFSYYIHIYVCTSGPGWGGGKVNVVKYYITLENPSKPKLLEFDSLFIVSDSLSVYKLNNILCTSLRYMLLCKTSVALTHSRMSHTPIF